MFISAASFIAAIVLIALLQTSATTQEEPAPEQDATAEQIEEAQEQVQEEESDEELELGSEEQIVAVDCPSAAPNDELILYTSNNGMNFDHVGSVHGESSVPHIIEYNDELIVTHQSFMDTSDLCGRMAYTIISEDGDVIDGPNPIDVQGKNIFNGFDPTLIEIDGDLALVYTVRPPGKAQPCISVALSDGGIDGTFQDIEGVLWCDDQDQEAYMDPSAIMNGDWLLVYMASPEAMKARETVNYVMQIDTDKSSSKWEIGGVSEESSLEMYQLGSTLRGEKNDECRMLFYGTKSGQIGRSCTNNVGVFSSVEWIIAGADPGVTRSSNGTYYMVIAE